MPRIDGTSDVTVYVDPAFHRRGIGRALYTALFDLLLRQGVYVACAGVTLPNEASVGLHEALGFTPVGVYRGVSWKFGAWRDVGWWQLRLREPNRDGPRSSARHPASRIARWERDEFAPGGSPDGSVMNLRLEDRQMGA